MRPGTHPDLRAHALGQGRGPRGADAAFLARFGRHPRHQGENWQITAGWRSRFSHCLLFNPTDSQSAAYNPLLEVRRGVHEVRDVQNIADIWSIPKARSKRNHWEKTSMRCWSARSCMSSMPGGQDARGVAFLPVDPGQPFELDAAG